MIQQEDNYLSRVTQSTRAEHYWHTVGVWFEDINRDDQMRLRRFWRRRRWALIRFSLVLGLLACQPAHADDRDRICQPSFSASIRPSANTTEALKRRLLADQGIPQFRIGEFELDHVVPICLYGPPLALRNLQLQLWPAAHAKDQHEVAVCRAYCRGELTLE